MTGTKKTCRRKIAEAIEKGTGKSEVARTLVVCLSSTCRPLLYCLQPIPEFGQDDPECILTVARVSNGST